MKLVTALEENKEKGCHVFLAGGITGCADWQSELVEMMKETDFIFHNPRRKDFPIHDPNASTEQIKWEFNALRQCDIIAFWFSPETLNPIVLFELGAWSRAKKPIVVGVHPDYKRKQDVEIQMSLVKPKLRIHYDLLGVALGINKAYKEIKDSSYFSSLSSETYQRFNG